MKVILLQDIKGKGKKGQLIDASDGYARNYLLPRKLAVEANSDNLNTMRMNDKAAAEKAAKERAEAMEISQKLKTLTVTVKAKGGGAGRLFGSVTSAEISDALKEQHGITIDRRRLVLDEPIKNTGTYTVKCKLGYEITGELTCKIEEEVFSREGSVQAILENEERKILAVRKGRGDESLERVGPILRRVYNHLNEPAVSGNAIPGLSTGFVDLDRKINGLNKTDLILIAGRPGMGKTSMGLNIALNVAKKRPDRTVAFFSLEMSREQLVVRLLSGESYLDSQVLQTRQLNEEQWGKLWVAINALSKTDIRVDDTPAITVAEISAKCRRLDNLSLILVDYLQLMTSAGGNARQGENRVQVVSEISRAFKIMAKDLGVPVICLSQLNRANESRADKRPMLSDLGESGAIGQDADEILFLYRDDYYNENTAEKNVCEVIVAKNRHGETGTVKLQWLPQFTSFADQEWKHAEP